MEHLSISRSKCHLVSNQKISLSWGPFTSTTCWLVPWCFPCPLTPDFSPIPTLSESYFGSLAFVVYFIFHLLLRFIYTFCKECSLPLFQSKFSTLGILIIFLRSLKNVAFYCFLALTVSIPRFCVVSVLLLATLLLFWVLRNSVPSSSPRHSHTLSLVHTFIVPVHHQSHCFQAFSISY